MKDRKTKNGSARRLKWVIFVPLLAAYSFVFCQIYLYIETLVVGKGHYVWRPYTSAVSELGGKDEKDRVSYLPGVQGRKVFSTNHLGLRGPDPTGADFRILVLGGSTAECHYLDDTETWPQRVAAELNGKYGRSRVVVNNAAKAGLEMRHYALQARQLIPGLKPVSAVIILPGPNDLIRFLSAEKGRDVEYPEGIDRVAFDRVVSAYPPWTKPVRQKSYKKLMELTRGQTKRLLTKTRLWKPKAQGLVRDPEGRFYEEARRRRRVAKKVHDLPEDKAARLDKELERYRALLERTVHTVLENGAMPVLLTHPLNYNPAMSDSDKGLWWAGALYGNPQVSKGLDYLDEESVYDLLQEYNRVTKEVYQSRKDKGAILVDLAARFRNRIDIYYDQWHFNELGAAEVGKAVADAVARETGPHDAK